MIIETRIIEDERRVRKELLQCVPLIIIAILIPCAALFIDLKPEIETTGSWFQRSGSLIVIIAVWIEFKLLSINGDVNPTGITDPIQSLIMKFSPWYKLSSYLAAVLAITGTLIWGYGDLLYKYS